MKDIKEMTVWEVIKSLPKRIIALVFNLISRWGIMLGATMYLLSTGQLASIPAIICWLTFCLIFLFKTDGVEMAKEVIKAIKSDEGE